MVLYPAAGGRVLTNKGDVMNLEVVVKKLKQFHASVQSFQATVKNRMAGMIKRIEEIDRRLTKIEKQIGVPTPTEVKRGTMDPDSRKVSLEKIIKDLNQRVGELEK